MRMNPVFAEYGLKDLLPLKLDIPDEGCTRPNRSMYCFEGGKCFSYFNEYSLKNTTVYWLICNCHQCNNLTQLSAYPTQNISRFIFNGKVVRVHLMKGKNRSIAPFTLYLNCFT